MTDPERTSAALGGGLASILVDERGSVVDTGEAAALALGLTREAARAARFEDLFASPSREAAARLIQSPRERTEILVPDKRQAGRGAVSARAFRTPHGVEVVVLDVTELYQRAFDGDQLFRVSFDLVCVAGTDGYFQRISPSFGATLGWSEEELLSRSFLEFVHPDDIENTLAEMEALASGEMTLRFENRYRTRAGGWRVLQWTSIADDDTGQIYAIARDVTEDRAVREQLRRARDLAESASRAKGSFVANVSHELRTPLSAVIGYSEMLLEDVTDAVMREDLQRINDAGQQLLDLINSILDLSKMEAGQIEVFVEPVAIDELLEQVTATIRPQVERNGNVLLVVDCPHVTLETDRRKLQQILLNLLSNAAKFTRDGQVILRTTVALGAIVFEVEDTGIGIAPDEMERVFAPFDQANADIARNYGGTGLGLAIASRFAALIGADLSVQSDPGAGSTFTVRVPTSRARDAAAIEVTGGYIALVDS